MKNDQDQWLLLDCQLCFPLYACARKIVAALFEKDWPDLYAVHYHDGSLARARNIRKRPGNPALS